MGRAHLVIAFVFTFTSAALAQVALVQGTQTDPPGAVEGSTESKYLHRSIERALQLSPAEDRWWTYVTARR